MGVAGGRGQQDVHSFMCVGVYTCRMVDLDKVVSVQEVSPAQQDKNHATFLVQCDGRTFQLQAIDEATMRK